MKKVLSRIFLIILLAISLFSITSYAEPENLVKLDYDVLAYRKVDIYISESETSVGKSILKADANNKRYQGSTYLEPGKTYFIHIAARGWYFNPYVTGIFKLNGNQLKFSNNSNELTTNPIDFRAYKDSDGFGVTQLKMEYYDTNVDNKIPGARYIYAPGNYTQVFFSTTITPVQPELNAETTVNNGDVKIAWNAISGAINYNIERSLTAGGPYTSIASDLTETNFLDKGLTPNKTYYYVVKAKISDTETITSHEVSATLPPETPTVNSKLKVVLEPEEKLQLSVDDDLNVNTQMSWSSSDPTVATVNGKGIVTALAPGNTVITVKSVDGSYTDYINVLVVENADDYRLAIDLKAGETARLTADDFTNTANITWAPMDSSIANVSTKGKVTALRKGLVLISAKDADGNIIGRVYVRVRE